MLVGQRGGGGRGGRGQQVSCQQAVTALEGQNANVIVVLDLGQTPPPPHMIKDVVLMKELVMVWNCCPVDSATKPLRAWRLCEKSYPTAKSLTQRREVRKGKNDTANFNAPQRRVSPGAAVYQAFANRSSF